MSLFLTLGAVHIHKKNPRLIKEDKFKRLLNSLLLFPKMLKLRGIVVDDNNKVLGGNMRVRALQEIAKMPPSDIKTKIQTIGGGQGLKEEQINKLITYWTQWLNNPLIPVIEADDLTEKEKEEFIIKDNLPFGEWDYDILANDFDPIDLQEWGLDVWNAEDDTKPMEEVAEEAEQEEQEEELPLSSFQEMMLKDVLYESNNEFEIPTLLLSEQGDKVELPLSPWGANSRLNKGINTYHFYVDDYRFEALFKDPIKLITSGCKAIVEPNCSLHDQTPIAYGLHLIYKKRWLARYCQSLGIKVYADLNVSHKFRNYNKMGIPQGYNAFFTRGITGSTESLKIDLDVAKEISQLNTPNLIVYGGGKDIKQFCQENNLLYITDYINAK